jgi:hypothetical protein
MTSRMLRTFSVWGMALVALGVLGGSLALAQSSTAVAAPAATGLGQNDHPALPDGPSVGIPTSTSSSVRASVSSVGQAPAAPVTVASVTVLEDTLIRVMTSETMNSKWTRDGTRVMFLVSEDVVVGGVLAIPRGATVHGLVIRSKKSGVLTGSSELTLKLVSLDLDGRSYPLYTYQFQVKGTSKTGPTEKKATTGAVVGAFVGGAVGSPSAKAGTTDVGRAASMTAGAAVGAGVGTIVSAATPGPGISIPAEAQVDFYLAAPITVPPVSATEAARMGQRLHGGGPSLYVRDDVR